MTREEEIKQKALKLYPIKERKNKKGTGIYDVNFQRRKAFEEGVKWADSNPFQSEEEQVGMGELGMMWQKKHLIDKACEWIRCNWRNYINIDANGVIGFAHWKSDFKKAMEE